MEKREAIQAADRGLLEKYKPSDRAMFLKRLAETAKAIEERLPSSDHSDHDKQERDHLVVTLCHALEAERQGITVSEYIHYLIHQQHTDAESRKQ
ncbi:hypothetical protein KZK78_004606 [Salmonella enterica]|nr:hypothetical protein [Salmonella enterica]